MPSLNFIFSCLLLGLSYSLIAQQDPVFPWQWEQQSYINPGAPPPEILNGLEQPMAAGIAYRQQMNLPEGPKTLFARFHINLNQEKYDYDQKPLISSGLHILVQDTDPICKTRVQVPARIAFETGNWMFSAGLSLNVIQHQLKLDSLSLSHLDDPILLANSRTQWRFGPGAGGFIKYAFKGEGDEDDYVFVGMGIPEIADINFAPKKTVSTFPLTLTRHWYWTTGAAIRVNDDTMIEGAIWARNVQQVALYIDGNIRILYGSSKQKIWIGAGYSNSNTLHFEVGFIKTIQGSSNFFRIGLGYEFNVGRYNTAFGRAFELSVSIGFGGG